jgi:hypothetical protein
MIANIKLHNFSNIDYNGIIRNNSLVPKKYKLFDDNYKFTIGNICDLYNTLLVINSINNINDINDTIKTKDASTCTSNNYYNPYYKNTNEHTSFRPNNMRPNNMRPTIIRPNSNIISKRIYNSNEGIDIYINNYIHNIYTFNDKINTYNYATELSSWNVYINGNINHYKLLNKNFTIL